VVVLEDQLVTMVLLEVLEEVVDLNQVDRQL
jgi:hypothetical protein